MKKALIIIAQSGYQDHELEGTQKGLEAADFEVVLASKEAGPCEGKFGSGVEAAVAMRDVDVADYDRIAFIGGPGAAPLADDGDALKLANDAARAEMPIGAICIAPTILAKAHILEGKEATVWDSGGEQAAILEQYGATYTGQNVTVDGTLITANGPEAAEEFGREFASA